MENRKFYKKFDFWSVVFAGLALVVSIVFGIRQIITDKEQAELSKAQARLQKEQDEVNNHYNTYTKYLDHLNYELSIKEGVEIEDWEVSYNGSTQKVKIPRPMLNVNTGYIGKTTLFVYDEGEMLTVNSFPTSSFLRENKDMTKKDPDNNSTSVIYGPLQIFGEGNVQDEDYLGLYSYYFLLIEGTDGTKTLNLVSYTFKFKDNKIEFLQGKVYSDAYMLDTRQGSLKTAFSDFRELRSKLVEVGVM
ncbi:hypothetical protein CI088_00210 [Enterococcus plantarum]|uniref:Uncharacterized protein n=1 Tax=Enterococcus plantarum TaxID=1077675 RepID=A0A2W3ZET2_9ENTE|nr:hypothetical protein [Enterococcus plantarum]PZL78228.1 hypothetical protein CI088_00210 [Enterococcus plantarum]